jgi:hypothetical protein
MNVNDLVSTYLNVWNETNAEARRKLIATSWAADATYVDPLFDVTGVGEFDALIGGFQQQYPGLRFVQTGEVEHHHDLVRFTWNLVTPTGDVIAKGTDVGRIDAEGRFASISGFFDQAPVLA